MKKPNQIFWIGITLIVVLGALFYSGKIGSVKIETDKDKTQVEIKATETQTAQPTQAPSTEIKVGNIEKTGGNVQVGTNQTIGSPDKDKSSTSTSSSPGGDTSISVGNIKETQGNVQIGSHQTIHTDKSKPEKTNP